MAARLGVLAEQAVDLLQLSLRAIERVLLGLQILEQASHVDAARARVEQRLADARLALQHALAPEPRARA